MTRTHSTAGAHRSGTRLATLLLPLAMASVLLLLLTAPPASAIMILRRTPAPGAVGVAITAQPTVTFDVPPAGVTTRFHLRNAAGATVQTILAPTAATGTVWRLDPTKNLRHRVTYTVVLQRGITDSTGAMLPPMRWKFTTR